MPDLFFSAPLREITRHCFGSGYAGLGQKYSMKAVSSHRHSRDFGRRRNQSKTWWLEERDAIAWLQEKAES
jgi:hypothetical protein